MELIALTEVLKISKNKEVNIYMDLKYVFLVLHVHADIWKERHFLTAKESPITYNKEIDQLLLAVQLPSEVAVITVRDIKRDMMRLLMKIRQLIKWLERQLEKTQYSSPSSNIKGEDPIMGLGKEMRH